MEFDYRLRPGVVTRSNALELMRAVGLGVAGRPTPAPRYGFVMRDPLTDTWPSRRALRSLPLALTASGARDRGP